MSRSSLASEVDTVFEAVNGLSRSFNSPRSHRYFEQRAGVEIDKLTEVILQIVLKCGDTNLRLSDLANRLGIELSGVSRKVQRLVDSGLVARTTDPNDARAMRLHATPEGRDLITQITSARLAVIEDVLRRWPAHDRQTFVSHLTMFVSDLRTTTGATDD